MVHPAAHYVKEVAHDTYESGKEFYEEHQETINEIGTVVVQVLVGPVS